MRIHAGAALLAGAAAIAACALEPRAVPGGSGGAGGGGASSSSASSSGGASSSSSSSSSASSSGVPAVARCNAPVLEVCNPFGLRLDTTALSGEPYWSFFKQTASITYYVPPPIALDAGAACAGCDEAIAHGLILVLPVRASGAAGTPASAPVDLPAFRASIAALLDAHDGAVEAIVVEEGADPPAQWPGSIDSYLAELAEACAVAHEKKVRCTDGGLSSTTTMLLLLEYELSLNNAAGAIALAIEAGDNAEVRAAFTSWPPATEADVEAALAQEKPRLDRAHALLAGVRDAGVDYASFRWYERGQDAFDQAIAFTRARTGCNSVACPDMGQRTQDSFELLHKAGDGEELGMRLVVWTSRDDGGSLIDGSGGLTTNGAAFVALTNGAVCGD